MEIDEALRQQLLAYQKNEITEHHIYKRLAAAVKSVENRDVLQRIAEDELRHYHDWKQYTGQDTSPDRLKAGWYYWVSRIFGITFGMKLMERGEEGARTNYGQLKESIPKAEAIARDENEHEEALLRLLDEERLQYVGSIVLGLNDALVELTGALAGLTLALQDTKLIALTGLITGIAAALSMGASEYLSTKAEETSKGPLKASIYTAATYVVTVFLLILPYLILENYYMCLAWTLIVAVLIIAVFNYYISVAKDEWFKKRFFEMAGVSLGVAVLSFGLGYVIRALLGVEV
ncbi:MAG TPA: rubrerythrin family protein [Candidatus Hydrogenedentes bacterium]|nr:rubrerythrin family protein [Candidatus Hydrogenedentota bacterium]